MSLLPGLSGFTVCRNVRDLDYGLELTIRSLSDVCDEVVVCDADSTDGTKEELYDLYLSGLPIRIVNWPWPDPKGDTYFFVKWLNHARSFLKHRNMLLVEADECLHEADYDAIRKAGQNDEAHLFHRLNFWRDAQHLSPDGVYCGHQVCRMGPTDLWMPSDAPDPHGPQTLATLCHERGIQPGFRIFHYGALRKPDAFCRKSRVMQGAIWGSCDDRILEAERTGQNWVDLCPTEQPLQPFYGTHPAIAQEWLRERGHKL